MQQDFSSVFEVFCYRQSIDNMINEYTINYNIISNNNYKGNDILFITLSYIFDTRIIISKICLNFTYIGKKNHISEFIFLYNICINKPGIYSEGYFKACMRASTIFTQLYVCINTYLRSTHFDLSSPPAAYL